VVLLLDEPTTFLDMAHQIEVLHLLRRLYESGHTIVLVVHDLNLAARYAHHLIAMRAGKLVAQGPPSEIMTPELLREVFNVAADVVRDPRTGVPLCLPYDVYSDTTTPAPANNGMSQIQPDVADTFAVSR
jgi:iron complex transport system ATP-binding protein